MTDNYVDVDHLNAVSITGEVNEVEVLSGEVNGIEVLSDIEIGGVIINRYEGMIPATTETLGGIIVGDHLDVTPEGRLSVHVTNTFSDDNTDPVTAAAVYSEIGNINALLATI